MTQHQDGTYAHLLHPLLQASAHRMVTGCVPMPMITKMTHDTMQTSYAERTHLQATAHRALLELLTTMMRDIQIEHTGPNDNHIVWATGMLFFIFVQLTNIHFHF